MRTNPMLNMYSHLLGYGPRPYARVGQRPPPAPGTAVVATDDLYEEAIARATTLEAKAAGLIAQIRVLDAQMKRLGDAGMLLDPTKYATLSRQITDLGQQRQQWLTEAAAARTEAAKYKPVKVTGGTGSPDDPCQQAATARAANAPPRVIASLEQRCRAAGGTVPAPPPVGTGAGAGAPAPRPGANAGGVEVAAPKSTGMQALTVAALLSPVALAWWFTR